MAAGGCQSRSALEEEAISDPSFEKQIELVKVLVIPDFSIGATVLLSKFEIRANEVRVHDWERLRSVAEFDPAYLQLRPEPSVFPSNYVEALPSDVS